jgi:integrase
MPTLKFTKLSVEQLPTSDKDQILCRDEVLSGFDVRVGASPKVFFAEGQVNHRTRRSSVPTHALSAWWDAVMQEPGYARDFLLLALFTGMRRNEIASLRWEYIDLEERALHILKTKNGGPFDLPLSDFLVTLLDERKCEAGQSPWVFPSFSQKGHIVETKKFTVRVAKRSNVQFTLNDLRRTFIAIAESLDVPEYALKRLFNHGLSGDLTTDNIAGDFERLRGPVSLITAKILQSVADKPTQPRRQVS